MMIMIEKIIIIILLSSLGHSWTDIASTIEKSTGLRYDILLKPNATKNPVSKAIFLNPNRVMCTNITRSWVNPDTLCNDMFELAKDLFCLECVPVNDERAVRDKKITVLAERGQWVLPIFR